MQPVRAQCDHPLWHEHPTMDHIPKQSYSSSPAPVNTHLSTPAEKQNPLQ